MHLDSSTKFFAPFLECNTALYSTSVPLLKAIWLSFVRLKSWRGRSGSSVSLRASNGPTARNLGSKPSRKIRQELGRTKHRRRIGGRITRELRIRFVLCCKVLGGRHGVREEFYICGYLTCVSLSAILFACIQGVNQALAPSSHMLDSYQLSDRYSIYDAIGRKAGMDRIIKEVDPPWMLTRHLKSSRE